MRISFIIFFVLWTGCGYTKHSERTQRQNLILRDLGLPDPMLVEPNPDEARDIDTYCKLVRSMQPVSSYPDYLRWELDCRDVRTTSILKDKLAITLHVIKCGGRLDKESKFACVDAPFKEISRIGRIGISSTDYPHSYLSRGTLFYPKVVTVDYPESNTATESEISRCEKLIKQGIVPDGKTDVTAPLQAVLKPNITLALCPGTYLISDTIRLPSATSLLGNRKATIVADLTANKPLFTAKGTAGKPAHDIVVAGLNFISRRSSHAEVLQVQRAHRVTMLSNTVRNMGLFASTTHLPINTWDGTKDPNATAGLTEDAEAALRKKGLSLLNRNITIKGNRVTYDSNEIPVMKRRTAVSLRWVDEATVEDNILKGFKFALVWWGGDANPARGGARENPRWVRNIVIKGNTATGGIWGSMGEGIVVRDNLVENCTDVCLDAEGSREVMFYKNTARNSVNSVLAVFFESEDVVFQNNTVIQDGSLGKNVFYNSNPSQRPKHISVKLIGNRFYGKDEKNYARIVKHSTKSFLMMGNRLYDTVLQVANNNSGDVVVEKNVLHFSRKNLALPDVKGAIHIGRNHGHRAVIRDNLVVTLGETSLVGIFAEQDDYNSRVETIIDRNRVKGFNRSIRVRGASANLGMAMTFHLRKNTVSGTICDSSERGRARTLATDNQTFGGSQVSVIQCDEGH